MVKVHLSQSVLLRINHRGQWAEENRLSHCPLNQLVTALKETQ